MEPDHPGMHRTDSIDFVYVVSGRVIMVLDDDKTVDLEAGDTVIQNGTRHGWRVPYDEPCRLLCDQHRRRAQVIAGLNGKRSARPPSAA